MLVSAAAIGEIPLCCIDSIAFIVCLIYHTEEKERVIRQNLCLYALNKVSIAVMLLLDDILRC